MKIEWTKGTRTSKEPKNPLPELILRFGSFDAPWSEIFWIDLFSKETQNLFSDSFGFKNPIPDFPAPISSLGIDDIENCV